MGRSAGISNRSRFGSNARRAGPDRGPTAGGQTLVRGVRGDPPDPYPWAGWPPGYVPAMRALDSCLRRVRQGHEDRGQRDRGSRRRRTLLLPAAGRDLLAVRQAPAVQPRRQRQPGLPGLRRSPVGRVWSVRPRGEDRVPRDERLAADRDLLLSASARGVRGLPPGAAVLLGQDRSADLPTVHRYPPRATVRGVRSAPSCSPSRGPRRAVWQL